MSILFSSVTISAAENDTEFFVGGIPREPSDLEGCTAFDNFIEELEGETEVSVHVAAYLYGEQETVRATPEEIAYFMKRIEMQSDFLNRSCDCIENSDFAFSWTPNENFEIDME